MFIARGFIKHAQESQLTPEHRTQWVQHAPKVPQNVSNWFVTIKHSELEVTLYLH